jgi:hypothetical protein
MKNRTEIKVTQELLKQTSITDEHLYRDLARKMVSDMPIDELHKLIKFKKTDPFSPESISIIHNYSLPEHERIKICLLREQNLLLYEAQCDL